VGVPLSVNQGVINSVQSTLRVGLQLYWKFDGTFNDSVGSLHLSQVGTISLAGAGKFGTGATFNGSASNYVVRADDTLLDLVGDFTISFWGKWASVGGIQVICDKTWLIYFENNALRVTTGGGILQFLSTAGLPNDALFHHAVLRRVGTFWTLFYDGTSRSTATQASNFTNSNSFRIGNWAGSFPLVNGTVIDEWAKWSRGLSDGEISQIYNSGAGLQL
jgi:hypothetical protein